MFRKLALCKHLLYKTLKIYLMKKTTCVTGKLDGYFYDENGDPRPGYYVAEKLIKEGHKLKASDAEDEKLYPPCNSEWSQDKGGRVYCTENRFINLIYTGPIFIHIH